MKEETKVEISWDRDPGKTDAENDATYKKQYKAAVEALGGVYERGDPKAPYDAMDAAIDRWDEERKTNPLAQPPWLKGKVVP